GEALVVAEVDPEQRQPDDHELREPVRIRRREDQETRALNEVLHPRLDQRPELVLGLSDERAAPERLGDAAVRSASGHLIGGVETEPDRELKGEMRPTAR